MKDNKQYGLPKLKKYPMPDKRHVRSAIRFFNYVSPANEKELAKAILKRMRKYGMSFSDFTVGEENRFIKYVPKKYLSHNEDQIMYSNNDFRYYKGGEYLAHYGKKGMKWKKHKASIERHDDAANSFASNSVYKEMAARKALRFGNRSLSTRVRKRTDQDISTNRRAGLKHKRLANANRRSIRSGGMSRGTSVTRSSSLSSSKAIRRLIGG